MLKPRFENLKIQMATLLQKWAGSDQQIETKSKKKHTNLHTT